MGGYSNSQRIKQLVKCMPMMIRLIIFRKSSKKIVSLHESRVLLERTEVGNFRERNLRKKNL